MPRKEKLKIILSKINDEFIEHRESCETCRTQVGLCKVGLELLLRFQARIQAEIDAEAILREAQRIEQAVNKLHKEICHA